jgi:hypothetical protein
MSRVYRPRVLVDTLLGSMMLYQGGGHGETVESRKAPAAVQAAVGAEAIRRRPGHEHGVVRVVVGEDPLLADGEEVREAVEITVGHVEVGLGARAVDLIRLAQAAEETKWVLVWRCIETMCILSPADKLAELPRSPASMRIPSPHRACPPL